MSLLTELDAFFTDHRQCGDLDAGLDGAVVWIACDRGARMARRADEGTHLRSTIEPPYRLAWTVAASC